MARDPRIPVCFLDAMPRAGRADQLLMLSAGMRDVEPSPGTPPWLAVLRLPDPPARLVALGGHPAACRCCVPRPGEAAFLRDLFQARARGEIGFFRGIVAHLTAAQAADLRAVLISDPFVSGSFVESGGYISCF